VAALISEGTALHDAGRYDEAIARYLQALGLDPDDSTARYELAFSYHAKKDYARCLEATRVGLREPGDNEARLYSIAGNCLDDSGRNDEAVATYREGLGKHPDDARLRYNLAVAFWRREDREGAIAEVLTTIADDPTYGSPYMLLASVEHELGRDAQALLALLRYLMVDHDSERSQQAAILAVGLFRRGVTAKPGEDGQPQVEVTVAAGEMQRSGIYGRLELARSLAAARAHQAAAGESAAQGLASAMVSYLAIASETAAAAAAATQAPEWRLVAAPVLALHERQVAESFAFLVAERAGVAGAADWVAANGEAMRRLEAALLPATSPPR